MTSASSLQAIAKPFLDAGQLHLLEHAARLDPAQVEPFLRETASLDWAAVQEAWLRPPPPPPPSLRPPQALTGRRQERQPGLVDRVAHLGRRFVAGGRVATALLAGGHGTRLGRGGPKGTLVLGPEPDRTLYRVHAERVAAASRGARRPVPLFVVVSSATEAATRAAFEDAGAWGLAPGQARVVRQAELPVLDREGRAILVGPGRVATAPDGHGGALRALEREGILGELVAEGYDALTTFQVDNPLGLPLDPVMLGWMVERRAQAIGKAVRKRDAEEKVGVFARGVDGRTRVVEYSEAPEGGLPPDLVLGSIAVHGFALAWLRKVLADPGALPLHRAWRRVPGAGPEETAPHGWKLERFVFDLFPLADRAEVHEVEREREFAPIKNAEGPDSPESARALVDAEVRRAYAARGLAAPEPPSLRPLELPDAP